MRPETPHPRLYPENLPSRIEAFQSLRFKASVLFVVSNVSIRKHCYNDMIGMMQGIGLIRRAL